MTDRPGIPNSPIGRYLQEIANDTGPTRKDTAKSLELITRLLPLEDLLEAKESCDLGETLVKLLTEISERIGELKTQGTRCDAEITALREEVTEVKAGQQKMLDQLSKLVRFFHATPS